MHLETGQYIFLGILFMLSIMDIIFRKMPYFIVSLWSVTGLIYSCVEGTLGFWDSGAGISMGLLHLAAFAVIIKYIYGVDKVIGGGDVKILMAIGAWFGYQSVLWTMALGSGIVFLFWIIRQDNKGLPFVPFLTIGLLLYLMGR